ncbi:unnamed protein product, partial [Prorocentrum cordatum]
EFPISADALRRAFLGHLNLPDCDFDYVPGITGNALPGLRKLARESMFIPDRKRDAEMLLSGKMDGFGQLFKYAKELRDQLTTLQKRQPMAPPPAPATQAPSQDLVLEE